MRAKKIPDLLRRDDRIAVSNITGREALKVTLDSQAYCNNIVGGWSLGKGGQSICSLRDEIPVFSSFGELMKSLPVSKKPNKIIVYSPPEAVYGEVKGIVAHDQGSIETIFIVTENVAVEVTAKIHKLCDESNIDILGCNTLGIINVLDGVRAGAVGGTSPGEVFRKGSVCVISNSGNMVNSIATYLSSCGMGISYGISTGKDHLILMPLKELISMAADDDRIKLLILYVEPGGIYEKEAVERMRDTGFKKPVVVYVSGSVAERHDISLGHSGAVIDGNYTSASDKMKLFDDYFDTGPYDPDKDYTVLFKEGRKDLKGIRVNTLHDIPGAVGMIADACDIKRDFMSANPLLLNPWFFELGEMGKDLSNDLKFTDTNIPEPYLSQINELEKSRSGRDVIKINMRNASHVSSNDGKTTKIYGHPLMDIMKERSFAQTMILCFTGEFPKHDFEAELVEKLMIACLTNGPGSISAQGAKLSASAGNQPHMGMIGTLASIGKVHGGNGAKAAEFLIDIFKNIPLTDPYDDSFDIKSLAKKIADDFKKTKEKAKLSCKRYEKIPCLGHPVYKDEDINYDPRERNIHSFLESIGIRNVFLEFYLALALELKENRATKNMLAVNIDAVIACIWLGICWDGYIKKRLTLRRITDIPFIAFAIPRVIGGAAEFLDHSDHGKEMDMRIPVDECKSLSPTN